MKSVITTIIAITLFTSTYAQEWYTGFGDSLWSEPEYGNTTVRLIENINGTLYITGSFMYPSRGIASRYNNSFHGMSTGIYGGMVNAITKYQNKIFVGGNFLNAGNAPISSDFAFWDGTTWTGTGLMFAPIEDFQVFDSLLFLCWSGDGNTIRIFYSTSMEDGTSGCYGFASGATTWSLEVYNGELYAGCDARMYKYAGNRCWQEFTGSPYYVHAMVVDTINDFLYIGGGFQYVANNIPMYSVTMWDGYKWNSMGAVINGTVYPKAMALYRSELYVGGNMDTLLNGVPVNYITRWDGNNWLPLGNGVNNAVEAIEIYRDTLWVGGYFWQVHGYTNGTQLALPQPAFGLAKWYMPPDTACNYFKPAIYTQNLQDTFYLVQGQVSVPFFNNNAYAESWNWDFGDGGTDTVKDPVHIYTDTGVYTVRATITHPQEAPLTGTCIKTIQKNIVVLINSGAEKFTSENLNFNIYPNPTTGDITAECVIPFGMPTPVLIAQNSTGVEKFKMTLESGFNKIIIPSSSWPPGMYMTGIYINNKQVVMKKFVKE